MKYGSAWYPEHWPQSRWETDVRLMTEAGMNVCRIAEFAWSSLEPTESYYDFAWLDKAIELLASHGLQVILGTPTAAPPAWLTHHHPDTLAIEPDGRPARHGNRCHYNPTSTTYLRYVRRIVEQMAKRYGNDPRVIGWQIDNEYNRVDYSEDTGRRFQAFLKEKYGSLECLNAAWSAAYWSQTYSDWREIPLPVGPHNPGLMLEFRRYATQAWVDFQHLQLEVIRQHAGKSQWITHNFMGWFDGFDHYKVAKDLDFASWDWYVGTGHHNYTATTLTHSLTRGFLNKNFWVMETQPGCVNWTTNNNMLNRGEARCMAWHAVAQGAEGYLYWQWRSAPGGQEQLHGSLLGADGAPRPFYTEASQIGAEFQKVSAALQGSTPHNEAAILHSYDARWSVNAQRHNQAFDPLELLRRYANPLTVRNIGVDVVCPAAELSCYKLLIAPAVVLLNEAEAQNLNRYVEQGGLLVLTVRCGQKDTHNALFPALQPGPLAAAAGAEVEEYFALDAPVSATLQLPNQPPAHTSCDTWAEMLRPLDPGTEVIARFDASNGWLDSAPAITISPANAAGGRVIMVGAMLDSAAQDSLTEWLVGLAGLQPVWPDRYEGIEFARRLHPDGRSLLFVINHTRENARIALPSDWTSSDLISGIVEANEMDLEPYGIRIFEGGSA